jgi:CRISPR/Cas system CSM-associated protein Csm3 (group 7 of RAMP superfamily)
MPDADFVLELKTESVNNRQTGTAMHPRTLERVAPGARFALRIDFDVYDMDSDFPYTDLTPEKVKHKGRDAILNIINDGLDLLQQAGIGAGTSRGYGQIEISDIKLETPRRALRLAFAPEVCP